MSDQFWGTGAQGEQVPNHSSAQGAEYDGASVFGTPRSSTWGIPAVDRAPSSDTPPPTGYPAAEYDRFATTTTPAAGAPPAGTWATRTGTIGAPVTRTGDARTFGSVPAQPSTGYGAGDGQPSTVHGAGYGPPLIGYAPGQVPPDGGSRKFPGAPEPRRSGMPLWAWVPIGAGALIVVALVAAFALPRFLASAGSPPPTTAPVAAIDLGFDGSSSLAATPIVMMDEGSEWSPLGADETEDYRVDRWEQGGGECLVSSQTGADVPGVTGSDDRDMSESLLEKVLGERPGGLDVVEIGTTTGGSVSLLAFEVSTSYGTQWLATRAFADSGDFVLLNVGCADGRLDDALVDSVLTDMRFTIEPSS